MNLMATSIKHAAMSITYMHLKWTNNSKDLILSLGYSVSLNLNLVDVDTNGCQSIATFLMVLADALVTDIGFSDSLVLTIDSTKVANPFLQLFGFWLKSKSINIDINLFQYFENDADNTAYQEHSYNIPTYRQYFIVFIILHCNHWQTSASIN